MRELKTWIDAAKKKLHDNVLGIALTCRTPKPVED
jgi:hypothetical protein